MHRDFVEVQRGDFKFWGHNCYSISNEYTVLIIDPWFSSSGAFYSSWFQYPKNHKYKENVLELLVQSKKSYVR